MVQIHSTEASRNNYSGGVRDRTAVDLTQIGLVLSIELTQAVARALDQIEATLREPSPEIPGIRLQDE
jgi:hypothetical protein